MILNVSGRTDIVAFYSEWFMNRYKEGYLDVRNPFYPNLVSRIYFNDVDLIVFCTKNPIPILKKIKQIEHPILFHVTITPYNQDIEPKVIYKKEVIEAVKKLSNLIGIENVYLRYDPIFLNDRYTIEYHKEAFSKLCSLLKGYVRNVIVSFLDECKSVKRNKDVLKTKELTKEDYQEIGVSFSKITSENKMSVQTCFESNNLEEYGFKKGECLSLDLAYKLTGKVYKKWSARKCNCANMVDVGVYNSCKHYCKYCYANFDEKQVENNYSNHNPNSSLLIGNLKDDDRIRIRYK